jgi:hypothetical protein
MPACVEPVRSPDVLDVYTMLVKRSLQNSAVLCALAIGDIISIRNMSTFFFFSIHLHVQ